MSDVPMLDLKAQYASIRGEVDAAVARVIGEQQLIRGPEVEALEKEIAAYSRCGHAIGVSSGTDAILAALMALGVGRGDEVVTSPYTFIATLTCMARLGARARLVDIDPTTFNIDASRVAEAIVPETKAVVPVHLYGQMADVEAIRAVTALPIVEDAAQAIGAELRGVRSGSAGTLGCVSFFPSKNLGAFGDGGMVLCSDAALADRVRLLRNHGQRPKYFSVIVGGNFHLDAIQAAVLRAKLPHLDGWTAKRQANARQYRELFGQSGLRVSNGVLAEGADVALPLESIGARHVYNQFVVRARRRDELRAFLARAGIASEIYYPQPMHLQECFREWGYERGQFPHSEQAAAESLAIPIHPELDRAKLERVVGRIEAFFSER